MGACKILHTPRPSAERQEYERYLGQTDLLILESLQGKQEAAGTPQENETPRQLVLWSASAVLMLAGTFWNPSSSLSVLGACPSPPTSSHPFTTGLTTATHQSLPCPPVAHGNHRRQGLSANETRGQPCLPVCAQQLAPLQQEGAYSPHKGPLWASRSDGQRVACCWTP